MENSRIEHSPAFLKLWARLRGHGHLWHATSLHALEAILRDGAIVANAGDLPYTHSQSKISFSHHLKAVSLFDFDTEDESRIFCEEWKWSSVLIGTKLPDVGVLIRVRRETLDRTKLILPDEISSGDARLRSLPDEIRKLCMYLPRVEALHIGPISATAFTGFIAIMNVEHWHEVPYGADSFQELSVIGAQWVKEVEDRHARGEYTFAEKLEAAIRASDKKPKD